MLVFFLNQGELSTCKASEFSPEPSLPFPESLQHSVRTCLWKSKYFKEHKKISYVKRSIVFILDAQVPAIHAPKVEKVGHLTKMHLRFCIFDVLASLGS